MRERHSFVLCDIAVIDGTGGPVREHAFIEVLGSRIARIGDMSDYAPHDGVEEVRPVSYTHLDVYKRQP